MEINGVVIPNIYLVLSKLSEDSEYNSMLNSYRKYIIDTYGKDDLDYYMNEHYFGSMMVAPIGSVGRYIISNIPDEQYFMDDGKIQLFYFCVVDLEHYLDIESGKLLDSYFEVVSNQYVKDEIIDFLTQSIDVYTNDDSISEEMINMLVNLTKYQINYINKLYDELCHTKSVDSHHQSREESQVKRD